MSYSTLPLEVSTWPLFAELVERNNGVYGGCWCMGYHPERVRGGDPARARKFERVSADQAHAALAIDETGAAQGWCQFGRPAELGGFKHRREYEKDLPPAPDWRIGCVFVDKAHRGSGVARASVEGALGLIGELGGGLVEAISEVTDGRQAQPRFLFTATAELFIDLGFTPVRQVGKHAWILHSRL